MGSNISCTKKSYLYVYAWLRVNGLETRFENSDELIALQLEMQLISNQIVSVHVFCELKMFVYSILVQYMSSIHVSN